jgi:hypothetical protein
MAAWDMMTYIPGKLLFYGDLRFIVASIEPPGIAA